VCVGSNGVGRTGTFCAVYAAVDEIGRGNGIVPVTELVSRLRRQRRALVQSKEQLKFCYDAVLCYAQDVLVRRKHSALVPTVLTDSQVSISLVIHDL